MPPPDLVVYYCVSTIRQDVPALGLDTWSEAVWRFLAGGACYLVEEFIKVESGKRAFRPKLVRAIQAFRIYGACL